MVVVVVVAVERGTARRADVGETGEMRAEL